ncbi:MAG: hypothetical protein V1662_02015 [Candidatus Omnitrophota bacterium]
MRKERVLFWVGIFYFLFCPFLFAEELRLTTYYPAPYGIYKELETTDNTYLAVNSGNVGIGLETPRAKLEVLGNIIAADPTEDNHVVTKKYVGGGLYGWCHYDAIPPFPPPWCESLPPATCNAAFLPANACRCPAGYQVKQSGRFGAGEFWYACYKQ